MFDEHIIPLLVETLINILSSTPAGCILSEGTMRGVWWKFHVD